MATPSAWQEVEQFWEEKQRRKSCSWGEVVLLALVQCSAPQPHDVLQLGLLVHNALFLLGELVLPKAGEEALVRKGTRQFLGRAALQHRGGGKAACRGCLMWASSCYPHLNRYACWWQGIGGLVFVGLGFCTETTVHFCFFFFKKMP